MLALLAYWFVRQKLLKPVSSVQLRRFVCDLRITRDRRSDRQTNRDTERNISRHTFNDQFSDTLYLSQWIGCPSAELSSVLSKHFANRQRTDVPLARYDEIGGTRDLHPLPVPRDFRWRVPADPRHESGGAPLANALGVEFLAELRRHSHHCVKTHHTH